MHAFEGLNIELRALLLQHFQVVATHSQRQDQWYKRSYQSFNSKHGDRKPLIVVPRHPREEWVPHLRRFATLVANEVEAAGKKPTLNERSTETKVFSDDVLEESHRQTLCRTVCGDKPLSPDMMQMSWWICEVRRPEHMTLRLKGIKALIACGKTDSLLRLATWPDQQPQKGHHVEPSRWKFLNQGWESVVDDILTLYFFLGILSAFPKTFIVDHWVPIAFWIDGPPFRSYVEAFGGNMPDTPNAIQKEMARCIAALVAAQAWCTESGFTPINWEDLMMDRFLYILGFEAWNRSRQGQGYLGCNLNVTKTAKSIGRIGHGDTDEGNIPGQIQKTEGSGKPMDPLKLREPKKEVVDELDDEEKQKMEELTAIETYEAGYGRKRSTKYLTKNKTRTEDLA
ncbi:hypothetical protein FHETE_2260 [Fusarium heterosporum]|uniref:Uncharacterized protein n=1 Tax=Fusarium heterosporum TaxID=42747 RepID=A0A8H5TT87_FUSHE|nr:hypothetical protein FHETE_2260 [Fusarium heterosporum]